MVEKHPWNDYSRVYAQSIEQLTFPMAVILFNSLNINEATNVLEGTLLLLEFDLIELILI